MASTIPQSDDVALAEIHDFARELEATPGRNQLMDRFGWGASRSTRLLRLYKEQSGPVNADQPGPEDQSADQTGLADQQEADQPGPADQSKEIPVRTGADQQETDQSPAAPSPHPWTGPQPTPTRPAAPPQTGQSEKQPTQTSSDEPGLDHPKGSPDRPTWTSPGMGHRSVQATTLFNPAPVRPASLPEQAPVDTVEAPAQPGPAPSLSPTSPTVQSSPAAPLPDQQTSPSLAGPDQQATPDRTIPDRPALDQTAPDQTTGPADQPSPYKTGPADHNKTDQTTNRTTPRSGGPDRQPYGLVAATLVISLSAFTAVWGGWVGLGRMVGFGPVNLLPGIGDGLVVDLAITLPLGIEAYAAAALWVAVGGLVSGRGRWFAGLSAGTALLLGAFGQATYHLLEVQEKHMAPDWVIVFVSVLPVIVLGAAGVLLHLVLEERKHR